MKIALIILMLANLTLIACGTQNSNDIAPSVTRTSESTPTKSVITSTKSAPTATNIVPTPTRIVPTPTKVVLTPGFMPSFASVSTQIGDADKVLDVYISLTDSEGQPVESTASATLRVRVEDRDKEEVFTGSFNLFESDLSGWSNRFSGKTFAGFIVPISLDEFERSLSGSTGTVFVNLDYGNQGYFELDNETTDIPTASQAEIDAHALEKFLEDSVELSNTTSSTFGWNITPTQAGCFSSYGLFGESVNGIRIDFEIENTSGAISSFYETILLQTPANLTSDPSYSSTLIGKSTLPGVKEKGYLLFEDLDCNEGDYRIVFSDYESTYLDEQFTFQP